MTLVGACRGGGWGWGMGGGGGVWEWSSGVWRGRRGWCSLAYVCVGV